MVAVCFLGTRRCCIVSKVVFHSVREILKGVFAGGVTFSVLGKSPEVFVMDFRDWFHSLKHGQISFGVLVLLNHSRRDTDGICWSRNL